MLKLVLVHWLLELCPRNHWKWLDWQHTYKRSIKERSRNCCCRGNIISIAYSGCVSTALVIQHAKCMCRITLSSTVCLSVCLSVCLALPYVSTSRNRKEFWKKKSYLTQDVRFDFVQDFWISWKSVRWKPSYSMWTGRHEEANSRIS
jgi:hypothetical protein